MVSGVRVGGGNQLCLWLIWVKKGHPSQPFSCRLFSTNPMRSQAKEAKINSSNNNSSYCLPCMLLCSHRDSEKLDPNTHQNPYACGNNQDQVFYVQEGRWTRNNLRENRAKDELRDKFCTKKNIFFKKKNSGASFCLCHHALVSAVSSNSHNGSHFKVRDWRD